MQEGFDCKDLDTLIFATPKTDIEQCVGRILRATSDERVNIPTIIDFIDMFSVFEKQGSKRKAFYKKSGYTFKSSGAPGDQPNPPARGCPAFLDDDE